MLILKNNQSHCVLFHWHRQFCGQLEELFDFMFQIKYHSITTSINNSFELRACYLYFTFLFLFIKIFFSILFFFHFPDSQTPPVFDFPRVLTVCLHEHRPTVCLITDKKQHTLSRSLIVYWLVTCERDN